MGKILGLGSEEMPIIVEMLPQHVVFGTRLAVVEHQHVAGIDRIIFLAAL